MRKPPKITFNLDKNDEQNSSSDDEGVRAFSAVADYVESDVELSDDDMPEAIMATLENCPGFGMKPNTEPDERELSDFILNNPTCSSDEDDGPPGLFNYIMSTAKVTKPYNAE
ncbi:hypothetical protein SARC_07344 [Sphaeroforma arctica JP610]|uniref:Uncharacterized protein n=1 Tax=Sphaeroforma arctica JP610 TaxID=667725 RepID=A0A0L0FUQ9_9EUKA|nr:hypothetical protein SARC_07344 [Sphaeroforma arctica JP610]KNC80296.1 hypothetical protein SARC_07344 [Sphaeroforma arctica JP610]|eukprot:XP_014154198.1 hypothetical protein SARC_07344 [Sphaeroforma arctica JP610]